MCKKTDTKYLCTHPRIDFFLNSPEMVAKTKLMKHFVRRKAKANRINVIILSVGVALSLTPCCSKLLLHDNNNFFTLRKATWRNLSCWRQKPDAIHWLHMYVYILAQEYRKLLKFSEYVNIEKRFKLFVEMSTTWSMLKKMFFRKLFFNH